MVDELMLKAGRGGAGNFHAKKDMSTQPQDIEATSLSHRLSTLAPTQGYPQSVGHRSTGRGGAGNLISHANRPSKPSRNSGCLIPSTKVPEGIDHVFQGHSGRGGAGNWSGDSEGGKTEEAFRTSIDKEVKVAVEAAFKPPPKVYIGLARH